ncbi:hypothetical protein JCM10213v2_007851 [Rhodosporidiobolus nylandii]
MDWRRQSTLTRLAPEFAFNYLLLYPVQLWSRFVHDEHRDLPIWHPGELALHLVLYSFLVGVTKALLSLSSFRFGLQNRDPVGRAVTRILRADDEALWQYGHGGFAEDAWADKERSLLAGGMTQADLRQVEAAVRAAAPSFLSYRLHRSPHPVLAVLTKTPTMPDDLFPLRPAIAARLTPQELEERRADRQDLAKQLWTLRQRAILRTIGRNHTLTSNLSPLLGTLLYARLCRDEAASRRAHNFVCSALEHSGEARLVTLAYVLLFYVYNRGLSVIYTPLSPDEIHPAIPPRPTLDVSFAAQLLPAIETFERNDVTPEDAFETLDTLFKIELQERAVAYWDRRSEEAILDAILVWKEVKHEQERKRR